MQKNIHKNLSSSGFTLLEILVAVVIIGILAAIATPSWLGFISNQRLNAAQGTIYSAMQRAKSQASKEKLSWQVSFRQDDDGTVKWAVHQADSVKFVPDAVKTNDNLWDSLDPNIHIDQELNSLGKKETTIRRQPSQQMWRVIFNYQGCPIYNVGDECTHTSIQSLGQMTIKADNGGQARRCVVISTLIGAMRTGKDHNTANGNNKYCY
jgi:prepilin-type N-terminal cleavage/methylation domain-containing protein